MEPIMNRVGEVYEPFKVHFLTKRIEKLQEDEVLIKVRASAICGSDLVLQEECIRLPHFRLRSDMNFQEMLWQLGECS